MLGKAIQVDQYVIQIDHDIDVYHICENVVHELLKSCGSVSKPFRHYQLLKGPISGLERSLPLIPSSDVNQVVHVLKVDFSVDSCFSWCIQEIRDQQEWVAILFGYSVEALEVDTKPKQAIFFPDEKDQGSTQEGEGWMNPVVRFSSMNL